MSKFFCAIVATLLVASDVTAFTKSASSFTGHASSVCSRAELTTELACPPSRFDLSRMRRGSSMSMPPFLKKLGLKKPEKPIFGGDDNEGDAKVEVMAAEGNAVAPAEDECIIEEEKELTETQKLLKQVKEAGTAGVVSYALWELAFWFFSIPVCVFGYRELTGHWPNLSDQEDLQKLGAEAFAFVNFARFAVPLRIGLALSTTPWIQENVIDKFSSKEENSCEEPQE
mmetsp:Transcript_29530/g.43559  ORF Transcript_29530/g.43559 Transcript_29530/m.43559 type:complete len:228 (+) Transcript_29530:61-744(+)